MNKQNNYDSISTLFIFPSYVIISFFLGFFVCFVFAFSESPRWLGITIINQSQSVLTMSTVTQTDYLVLFTYYLRVDSCSIIIVFVEVGKVLLYVYSTKQTGVDILLYFFFLLYIVSASLICPDKVNYVF